MKHLGTVIQFDSEKKTGAITCPDFPERVKFEYRGAQEISKGSRISFETLFALGRPLAVNITILTEKAYREQQGQFELYIEEEFNKYKSVNEVKKYLKDAVNYLSEKDIKKVFMLVRSLEELS